MKTIQEVLELVYSFQQLINIKLVTEILPSKVYPFDISFLVFNFNNNMFGELENCAERYIYEHTQELFDSSSFSKLDLLALVYPKNNIQSIDTAIPISHLEFLRTNGLKERIPFLVMDYNNDIFGEVVNLAEKFILKKFIDGEKFEAFN